MKKPQLSLSVFWIILLVLIGLFYFTPLSVFGQTGSSVWRISNNNNIFFLGGSVHILREQDFPIPEEFYHAFEQSSIVVLETDIEAIANPDILQLMLTQMFLPDGQTLDSILDSGTFELLQAKCVEIGFSIESVIRFRPSVVINMLTMAEIQNSGFVQQGVDNYFLEKAKDADKPLSFLESIESQINLLFSMGEGYENEFVTYSLMDMENSILDLDSLVSEWKDGRIEYTEQVLLEMKNSWPAIYSALIIDRHNAWMPFLESYLTTEEIEFVIVGYAHLPGPDGLLRRLENSGYTVEPFQ